MRVRLPSRGALTEKASVLPGLKANAGALNGKGLLSPAIGQSALGQLAMGLSDMGHQCLKVGLQFLKHVHLSAVQVPSINQMRCVTLIDVATRRDRALDC